MGFGPLRTERLTIRRPEIGDVDALHQRRNHPDAARYQDWTFPYPTDTARQTISGAAVMDGPAEDEWWMATIVERGTGTIVGDIGIHQRFQGRAVEIGYTLHPDHWGRGLATEAVSAMVDALAEGGVHRLSATTHPDNVASIRLLERLGFEFEGRGVEAYFDDDGPGDGLLFGLTAPTRARWLARPLDRPVAVRLVEIDDANHRAVAALQTHYSQRLLVAPVAVSYADALFPPIVDGRAIQPWLRAIEIDDGPDRDPTLVGFVMLATPTGDHQEPYLWRLLIDRWHQRRGIASLALDEIEDRLGREGHATIRVHWEPGPGSPEPFYLARGYEPTGEIHDGEVEGRKRLR